MSWDFPGGPVVKTPPSNAQDEGSVPGRETKIPHAVQCSQKIKVKNKQKIPKNQNKQKIRWQLFKKKEKK